MANRNSEERNVRKLSEEGNTSVGLTLPIELVRKLGWRVRQKSNGAVEWKEIGG